MGCYKGLYGIMVLKYKLRTRIIASIVRNKLIKTDLESCAFVSLCLCLVWHRTRVKLAEIG